MTGTQTGADVAAAATTVGVVAESGADERRVALVPKAVSTLINSGVPVVVESGGERALLPDQLYTDAGATIGDAWAADVVVKVAPPSAEEVARLRPGQTLIGFWRRATPTTRSVR
jgi:NAD(P) transhydrogenase subunit alpha